MSTFSSKAFAISAVGFCCLGQGWTSVFHLRTSKKVAPEGSVDTAELCQLRFTLNLHRQPKTTTSHISHSWNWKNGIGEHWFVARCSKSSQVPMICLCESIRLFQRFWKSSFAFHSQAKPLAANKVDISLLTLYIMNGHEAYLCKQNSSLNLNLQTTSPSPSTFHSSWGCCFA